MDAPVPPHEARIEDIEELIRASAKIGLIDSGLIGALIKVGQVDDSRCATFSRFDSAF